MYTFKKTLKKITYGILNSHISIFKKKLDNQNQMFLQ